MMDGVEAFGIQVKKLLLGLRATVLRVIPADQIEKPVSNIFR